ncbi:MAG TPA: alpha/beta fold hydrolase [Thermoanaerobaculia bacterium]|nr:alpha/beta fold hydrolase [Thermoanaerobaculia bacterium]
MARRTGFIPRVVGVCLVVFLAASVVAYEPCEDALPQWRLVGSLTLPGPVVAENRRAAIVFVHGFTGNGRDTWTNANGTYWPLLAGRDPDFALFDTYAFEYETSWWGPCRRITDLAESLNTFIVDKGLMDRYSRVVFVAHSQGGLIVRQYMIRYQETISGRVPMVVLYGTPSAGSELAQMIGPFSRCRQIEDLVESNYNITLTIQLQDWQASKSLKDIPVHCAVEDLTTLGLKIVDRASAERGCTTTHTLSANHIQLVKPACADDERHVWLRNKIRDLSKDDPPPTSNAKADAPVPETAKEIAAVWKVVNDLRVNDLVGQLLLVGVEARNSTEAGDLLESMIRRNRVGNVLLHEDNFADAATGRSLATAQLVASLTDRLQSAAATTARESNPGNRDVHREVPLTIAVNDGTLSGDDLGFGGTQFPPAMFLGATRDASAVYNVARGMASELRAVGINAVLGPNADINTCVTSDLVGRKSFGAHKEIVTPLSFVFMRGLQEGGVQSFMKHYPGLGSAEGNAIYAPSRMAYADLNELETKDLLPFEMLMAEGVDGVITSHVTVPAIADTPVTFCADAVQNIVRRRLGYFRVLLTDDLSVPAGILKDSAGRITHTRAEMAIEALEAGHDVLTFARITSNTQSQLPRGASMSVEEFDSIVQQVIRYFTTGNRLRSLRERVARVLTAKLRIVPAENFRDPSCWMTAFNPANYQDRLDSNAKLAREVGDNSLVLITRNGAVVNDANGARDFNIHEPGHPALLSEGDKVVLVEPAKRRDSQLLRVLTRESGAEIVRIPLIYGWADAEREQARIEWNRSIPINGSIDVLGQFHPDPAAVKARVDEILRAALESKTVIFGVVTADQAEILVRLCERLQDRPIIVLLYREPHLLPASVYLQSNVSVISLPGPDSRLSADVLLGRVTPRPATYLALTIPGVLRREIELGMPVQNYDAWRDSVRTTH